MWFNVHDWYLIFHFLTDGDDSDYATIQSNKEMQRLRKQIKGYEEENNLLKYKIELLLDMVWYSRLISSIVNMIWLQAFTVLILMTVIIFTNTNFIQKNCSALCLPFSINDFVFGMCHINGVKFKEIWRGGCRCCPSFTWNDPSVIWASWTIYSQVTSLACD